jgi:hypothetical protein
LQHFLAPGSGSGSESGSRSTKSLNPDQNPNLIWKISILYRRSCSKDREVVPGGRKWSISSSMDYINKTGKGNYAVRSNPIGNKIMTTFLLFNDERWMLYSMHVEKWLPRFQLKMASKFLNFWFCYAVYNSHKFNGFNNCTLWSITVVITLGKCAHRTPSGVRERHTYIGLIKSNNFVW